MSLTSFNTIISTPLTSTLFVDSGDCVLVDPNGSIITVDDFGITNNALEDIDINITVRGDIDAGLIGIGLFAPASGSSTSISRVIIGASASVSGQSGLAIVDANDVEVEISGTLAGGLVGLEVNAKTGLITVNGSVTGGDFGGAVLSGNGARSTFDFTNNGTVTSAENAAVLFSSNTGGTLRNRGTVDGANGVSASGSAVSILNSGTLNGELWSGIELNNLSGEAFVRNSGTLTAGGSAIFATETDVHVVNTGTISAGVGIFVDGDGSHTLIVRNFSQITGGSNAVEAFDQILDLENYGTVDGDIVSQGDTVDRVANSALIDGSVHLGGNADAYDATATGRVSGTVFGEGGADILVGGDLADRLDGGFGKDVLYGNGGTDRLVGEQGDDTLIGGAGNDVLVGGADDDTLRGGDDDDWLSGGIGSDVLLGGHGDDTVLGGTDNDQLTGGNGNDVLEGNAGDDDLSGGYGNDDLDGGLNADRLDGGAGDDTLTGGNGVDTFVFEAGGGLDTVTDFTDDQDVLELNQNLWVGTKTVAEVLADHATVVGSDLLFDFGNGNVLTVLGVTSIAAPVDDIILV